MSYDPVPAKDTSGTATTEPEKKLDDKLWAQDAVSSYQGRWREVQLRFVDDPRAAADAAEALVGEALDELSTTVAARKKELDTWHGGDGNTEQMRLVVRRYRNLLDQMLHI